MSPPPRLWVERVSPTSLSDRADLLPPEPTESRKSRDQVVDAAGCVLAALLGALFLSPSLHGDVVALSVGRVAVDVSAGALACGLLWWRRRWALGVALSCLALGIVSISATPAGLLALLSLAVHRPARPALLVAGLWIPAVVVFAAYSPTTDALAVLVRVVPIVVAVTAFGMVVRARRQLRRTLHERAERAEDDRRRHVDLARTAERNLIAREMHDVLAHRISLLALQAGALEVRPDLPPEQVREAAALLRSTARQALEELRGVIGLLREESGLDQPPPAPQPSLPDIGRLVEETRRSGAVIELELAVDRAGDIPHAIGRDAYRIVQEALTNVGKHARGTPTLVRVVGTPSGGLHVSVRNRQRTAPDESPGLPGSGTGLLGLAERVALAGGTLVHGPDGSGDFVVEAELPCRP